MRKQTDVLRILILVFAGLIAALVIFGSIYLISASKKLKSIELSPDFVETELAVGTSYNFSINTTPAKASLKKVECVVDDPMCTFEVTRDGKATLTTGLAEGTVTVYVECKDKKSQVLTFNVIDLAARAQAEAEAAAAAAAAAEAEAAAAEAEMEVADSTKYVKCIGDDVRVRAQNNTDCDILGKAMNGDVFEKVEEVEDWTHIIFKGGDGYMKSEYLQEISEEEAMTSLGDSEAEEESEQTTEKKKEETTTEKKQEEAPANNEETASATQSREEAEAKAAAAQAEAQAALEAAAAAQAAAAAAGTVIHCKDGDCLVNSSQLQTIHATWDFAGDAVEMAGHHSVSELEAVVGAVTRL